MSDVTKSINVIILEDHPLYREGLLNLLNRNFPRFKYAYIGGDFLAAKDALNDQVVSLAIVDLHLGDNRQPSELVGLFANKKIPVLVISALNNFDSIRSAFAMGALGFVSKDSGVEEIANAVRSVIVGKEWVNNHLAKALGDKKRPSELLSAQERKALILYASGLKLDVVARRMEVAPSTAKQYIDRAKQKYRQAGVPISTKTEIYRVLRDEGIIQ